MATGGSTEFYQRALNIEDCRETDSVPYLFSFRGKMIKLKLKYFAFRNFIKIRNQAMLALQTADFYGNLLTDRQKFNIAATSMVLFTIIGASIIVQLIGFIYLMDKLTPKE